MREDTDMPMVEEQENRLLEGQVVKLDRGYPLVRLEDGHLVRCEHATALVKDKQIRAVIGDIVEVSVPEGHDKGIIERIRPRSREFVRKDPTERMVSQVLAANFDRVFVAQPLSDMNFKRLERELVLAYEGGADVTVVLTKADLAEDEEVRAVCTRVGDLMGSTADIVVVSAEDPASVEAIRALVPAGTTAVFIGKSGVGKSSLVNLLVGSSVQETAEVRSGDGKGRHTTVSREMISVPGGGQVIDMPGVRGMGLWDADAGIEAAFPDMEDLARKCRFRDCRHEQEPGCAVRAAVEAGDISEARFASYQSLKQETADVKGRREEARRMRGEKASENSEHTHRSSRGKRAAKKRDSK